jgi:hypothetical protein
MSNRQRRYLARRKEGKRGDRPALNNLERRRRAGPSRMSAADRKHPQRERPAYRNGLQGEIGQAQQRDNTRDHQRDIKFFIRGHVRSVARGSWLAGIQSCRTHKAHNSSMSALLDQADAAAFMNSEFSRVHRLPELRLKR